MGTPERAGQTAGSPRLRRIRELRRLQLPRTSSAPSAPSAGDHDRLRTVAAGAIRALHAEGDPGRPGVQRRRPKRLSGGSCAASVSEGTRPDGRDPQLGGRRPRVSGRSKSRGCWGTHLGAPGTKRGPAEPAACACRPTVLVAPRHSASLAPASASSVLGTPPPVPIDTSHSRARRAHLGHQEAGPSAKPAPVPERSAPAAERAGGVGGGRRSGRRWGARPPFPPGQPLSAPGPSRPNTCPAASWECAAAPRGARILITPGGGARGRRGRGAEGGTGEGPWIKGDTTLEGRKEGGDGAGAVPVTGEEVPGAGSPQRGSEPCSLGETCPWRHGAEPPVTRCPGLSSPPS